MSRLHRTPHPRTLGKIKTYLGGIYRQFLRNGDVVILFNGEPVTYEEPPVLVAARYNDRDGDLHTWRKDVDIRLDSGRHVTGFVAVREKGDTRQGGLALFYRRKVVTGSGEEMYKPVDIYGSGNSFQSQRLFGELHMDDFNVTYTKDALVWYDEEDELVEALREEIDSEPLPLLKQAKEYRKRDPELAPAAVAGRVLDSIQDAFSATEYDIQGTTSDDTSTEPAASVDAPFPTEQAPPDQPDDEDREPVDRRFSVDFQGTTWEVHLRLVSDEAISRWLTVQHDDEKEIALTVNQAHPFMRAWCEMPGQELEPVWRVAIALGLAQEMARLGGAKLPGMVTENVNNLLRTVLAHKS